MSESRELSLRSLRSTRRMSLPQWPKVTGYGVSETGAAHDIQLFPAILRRVQAGEVRNRQNQGKSLLPDESSSSCFFHTDRTASAICEVSGRLICDLCTTQYEGKTVSFEAFSELLPSHVKPKGRREMKGSVRPRRITYTKWDDVVLSLAVLPMLFFFVTILTAPAVLIFTAKHWREGPTSPVRRTRIRYVIAVFFALLQLLGWGLYLFFHITESASL